jgi:WD40 repeat protein
MAAGTGIILMAKLCIQLLLPVLIVFVVITGGAMLVGSLIDTYAVTALISHSQGESGLFDPPVLFDIQRNLRASYKLPIQDIFHLALWYGNERLIITTHNNNFEEEQYERGLYVHNLYTGETYTIQRLRSETSVSMDIYYPTLSLQQDKLVFFEDHDDTLYLYRFQTREKSPLRKFDGAFAAPSSISWSPDGQHVAAGSLDARSGDQKLLIFDVYTNEVKEFSIPFDSFYPEWSEDGQYVLLQRYSESINREIYVLRVSDGERLTFTDDFEALTASWGECEDQWLTYIRLDERERQGFIRNLKTGETVRVRAHPLLTDLQVGWIYGLEDCEHFLINGYTGASGHFDDSFAPLYVVNADLSSVRLMHSNGRVIDMKDDSLIYESIDLQTKRRSIYQRTISPYSPPQLLAEFDSTDTWMEWSPDYSYALYTTENNRSQYSPFGGRLAMLDMTDARTLYLTRENEMVSFYRLHKWGKASP